MPNIVYSAAAAQVLFQHQCGRYDGVAVQLIGTFVATISFEASNNEVDWVPVGLMNSANIGANSFLTSVTSATGVWIGPCPYYFFRARVSSYTSGTVQGIVNYTEMTVSGPPAPVTILGGNAAEDAASTANPVVVGGIVRNTTPPLTFAAGDVVRATMSTSAQLVTKPFSVPEADWSFACAAGGVINTTDVALAAAAGASLRRYITSMTLKNVNAVAGEVVLKDGATVIWRGHLPASMITGENIIFPTPLKTTANTALNFACITTGQQVYVNAQGYTGI